MPTDEEIRIAAEKLRYFFEQISKEEDITQQSEFDKRTRELFEESRQEREAARAEFQAEVERKRRFARDRKWQVQIDPLYNQSFYAKYCCRSDRNA